MTTPTSTTVSVTGSTTVRRPFRLGGRTRKSVLAVHIGSAGAWIGIDVVMGVLIFTALLTEDADRQALALQALELFAIWPLFVAGVTCLLSGILLGLGSKYGLLRFWWVALKLVFNLLLSALVLIALRPAVIDVAAQARLFLSGPADVPQVGDLIYPPIVSSTLLISALVLSIFKPWGRIRKGRRRESEQV